MATAGGSRLAGMLFAYGLFVTALLSVTGPVANGLQVEVEVISSKHVQPLGMNECTYGPSYWCQNITNAAGCKAVKHCIQTIWETHTYPEDNDDICTICKNMVKEARDTLTSNATLDELKQVFYGSCQLLPLKVIKTECKKLADDFIPELVDTLASEMDPNVVCTVSGLCNSARIDKLLLENKEKMQPKINNEHHTCEKCTIAMNKGERLVDEMSKNDVINKILMMCGELSSYSDACSSIVLTYHNEIYNAVKTGFTKRNVCLLSGMCSEAFHPHTDGYKKSKNALMGVEISNAGERGRIEVQKPNEVSDELTCEFCEAMVKHLRDILVSNTTENQFLDVLNGLCKQTKSFSAECLSIVEEHYTRIYQFLTNELDGNVLCSIVGICSKPFDSHRDLNYFVPMFPILPVDLIQTQEDMESASSLTAKQNQNNQKLMLVVDKKPSNVLDSKPANKSPIIDLFYKKMHVVVNAVDMPKDKTVCFLCQSILNYVQQELTDPKSEEDIRAALEKSCTVVPASFEQQCEQFVDQYGDAFISLIVQEVDPSIVCPELKLCPAVDLSVTSKRVDESANHCPMCIVFMSALESEVTNTDTEKVIEKKLNKLCAKLPLKWKEQCTDFVSNKYQSIINLLVSQVKPEEICVLLEICEPKLLQEFFENDIEKNMVVSSGQVTLVLPGYNIGQLIANNYRILEKPKVPTPFCVVCTVVMKYLNGEIKDKSNQEEIEQALDSLCSILPNVEENECQTFVDTNFENIVKAIKIGTDPAIACVAFMVCLEEKVDQSSVVSSKKVTVPEIEDLDVSDECVTCETFVTVLFTDHLSNDSLKIDDINMTEVCYEIDTYYKDKCLEMIESYAPSFKNLYNQVPRWMMCEKMSLCETKKSYAVRQYINSNCYKGETYWCKSLYNAKECKAESFCKNIL